eukprot:scaffold161433_cov18-Tisochrysis_lutea.AAC.2
MLKATATSKEAKAELPLPCKRFFSHEFLSIDCNELLDEIRLEVELNPLQWLLVWPCFTGFFPCPAGPASSPQAPRAPCMRCCAA